MTPNTPNPKSKCIYVTLSTTLLNKALECTRMYNLYGLHGLHYGRHNGLHGLQNLLNSQPLGLWDLFQFNSVCRFKFKFFSRFGLGLDWFSWLITYISVLIPFLETPILGPPGERENHSQQQQHNTTTAGSNNTGTGQLRSYWNSCRQYLKASARGNKCALEAMILL